jgi:hypothetical protein
MTLSPVRGDLQQRHIARPVGTGTGPRDARRTSLGSRRSRRDGNRYRYNSKIKCIILNIESCHLCVADREYPHRIGRSARSWSWRRRPRGARKRALPILIRRGMTQATKSAAKSDSSWSIPGVRPNGRRSSPRFRARHRVELSRSDWKGPWRAQPVPPIGQGSRQPEPYGSRIHQATAVRLMINNSKMRLFGRLLSPSKCDGRGGHRSPADGSLRNQQRKAWCSVRPSVSRVRQSRPSIAHGGMSPPISGQSPG